MNKRRMTKGMLAALLVVLSLVLTGCYVTPDIQTGNNNPSGIGDFPTFAPATTRPPVVATNAPQTQQPANPSVVVTPQGNSGVVTLPTNNGGTTGWSPIGLPTVPVSNPVVVTPIPFTPAPEATPVGALKSGSQGEQVRNLQRQLKALGFYNGQADGDYGPATEEAVKAFQKKHGLEDDGIIGVKTWTKLAATAPTVKNKKSDKEATLAAQFLLGFTGDDLDGICGSKTKARIKSYQSASKLSVDGICGAKTWAALLGVAAQSAPATTGSRINDCIHYIQWDSKWKNVKYSIYTSKQTIGSSGCGTTAMAMILAQWIDKNITPVETSALSVDNGFRTRNSGTAWGFYEFCFKHYGGFSKFVQTNSLTVLKAALAEGALAVCSMNNNDNCFWTTGGHFITAIGVDGTYIYANDPNKSAHPRKQKHAKFQKCMKQAFIFWP